MAIGSTAAKSTSPVNSPDGSLSIPTSMTTAPGFTSSLPIKWAIPVATIKISAWVVDQERLTVQQLAARLQTAAQAKTQQTAQQLQALTKQLHSLDPLKIMERGYTYVTRNGKVVNQAAQLNTGEPLLLHFADGEVTVTITDIKEKKNGK